MRCGCPQCGAYMVHAEGRRQGCVCQNCGAHCNACLGTNTVISKEAFLSLRHEDWFDLEKEAQNEREYDEMADELWERSGLKEKE